MEWSFSKSAERHHKNSCCRESRTRFYFLKIISLHWQEELPSAGQWANGSTGPTSTDSSSFIHFYCWHCITQSNLLTQTPHPYLRCVEQSLVWKKWWKGGTEKIRDKKKLKINAAQGVKLTDMLPEIVASTSSGKVQEEGPRPQP